MREKRQAGVWELRVDLGHDPITGARRQRSRTFRGGKREAQRALAELVTESAEMRAPSTEGTVGFLLEEWFALNVDDWSPTTARRYRGIIDRDLVPAIGDIELRRLEVKDLDDLYRSIQATGRKPPVQVHAVIRRALVQAQRWGWVQANVAAIAKRPVSQSDEVEPPTVPELRRILAEAPSAAVAVLWRVKAELGARRGEMCGLQWGDIGWETGVVHVRRAVIHDGPDLVVKDPKSHHGRRVSVDVGVLNLLAEHRIEMEKRASGEGCELGAQAFIWSPEPDGRRPMRPDQVTGAWRRARARARLDHVRLHDLRHLNATLQMASGVPLETIRKRLGHASSAMLHQVYGHALPADDGAAAQILGRLLGDG